MGGKEKKLTPESARLKMYRYCAYQERSHQEVKNRLISMGVYGEDLESIVTQLITEGFLNEERYAKSYASGKFRQLKWGRVKIANSLEQKGLTRNCIKSGLSEIPEQEYREVLRDLLEKKLNTLDEQDVFIRRERAAAYAIRKGFEADVVWAILKSGY